MKDFKEFADLNSSQKERTLKRLKFLGIELGDFEKFLIEVTPEGLLGQITDNGTPSNIY